MKPSKIVFWILSLFVSLPLWAQEIPDRAVLTPLDLTKYLKEEVRSTFSNPSAISKSELANYFRERFSERYFYDWKNFDQRFKQYQTSYQEAQDGHLERAQDHLQKFPGQTQWKLPFNYQNGQAVNAYALRHLARQHKTVDIAFEHYYKNKNTSNIYYFTQQMNSLNEALAKKSYERIADGNGVYEAFRSGYRVLNWLQIHTMFLSDSSYSDTDQLTTIATLLQHGKHLYTSNVKFKSGNHQTRGLSALAMIAILFRDFQETDGWYTHAMKLLKEHLSKEINEDGFQFERTVHYHMSDIGNYFYVFQLAKTSKLYVEPYWEQKLKALFETLTKIAYPDKSAPVLSDDTDAPWAEKNDISGALTLGYLLFNDPQFGYFSNPQVDQKMYWYLNSTQLAALRNLQKETPKIRSTNFPTTGYYIMRNGWDAKDKMMIISAGLDKDKPDHQHGDMLGIQAMANGKVILPNYQVRYSLEDLELFKNSMVKNVALVDDQLQGKQYASNQGGSGFGKFLELPNPTVVAWETNKDLDVFIGQHDGFKSIGVAYSRQVLFVKDGFWIVKDNFKSEKSHIFKQVWQGHYSFENTPNLLRASFDNGTGLDLFQLQAVDAVTTEGSRGKEWSIVSKKNKNAFQFITVVYPFSTYDKRITDSKIVEGWSLSPNNWKLTGTVPTSLSKDDSSLLFSVRSIENKMISFTFSKQADVFVKQDNNQIQVQLLSEEALKVSVKNKGSKTNSEYRLLPGKTLVIAVK